MAQASEQNQAPPANTANGGQQQQQEEESPWKVIMSTVSNFAMLFIAFNVVKNALTPKQQDNQPSYQEQTTTGADGTQSQFVKLPERTEYSQNLVPIWKHTDSLQLRVYLSELETLPNPIPSTSLVYKSNPIKSGEQFEFHKTGLSFKTTENIKNNGSLFAHTYLVKLPGELRDTQEKEFNYVEGNNNDIVYYKQVLNHYIPLKKEKKMKKLFEKDEEIEVQEEPEVEQVKQTESNTDKKDNLGGLDAVKNLFKKSAPVVSHWYPNITIQLVQDGGSLSWQGVHPAVKDQIKLLPLDQADPQTGLNQFYPIIYFNKFWILQKNLEPINETVDHLPLNIEFSSTSMWKFQLQTISTVQFTEQLNMMGSDASELDIIKETLMDNSPWMLGATFIVSILHSLFDFLAFKNDISFWKQKKDNIGISVRTLIMNIIFQLITFLYLFDNSESTSWMIILSSGASLLIEVWKVKKAMNIEIIPTNGQSLLPYKLKFNTKEVSELEEKTEEYDQQAYTYLSYIAYPLLICYAIYSMLYQEHKGWYSFFINTAVGFVYAFGFITMTPQLFINYKLKSVSHMPWRTFMYKALNTFVDDMFAFIIKMPFLHRLACLRDDVVFFVYLYQRWIYPEDHSRPNEYGQVGSSVEDKKDKLVDNNDKKKAEGGEDKKLVEETKKEK